MIRELWNRYMDGRRALSLVLLVVGYGLLVVALAMEPGVVTSRGADPRWIVWSAPVFIGMALRGYAFRRRTAMRRAIAQAGLLFLMTLAVFVLASLINPIVAPNPRLGGDAWAGLFAIAAVVVAISGVLWERNRDRQRIAVVLLAAVCLIIAGVVGLRAGGPGTPIGTVFLVAGILGVPAAALQVLSQVARETADPVT